MCWKTTCDTHAVALAVSTPARLVPSPRSHSTFTRRGLCSRARRSISADTSSARTSEARAASAAGGAGDPAADLDDHVGGRERRADRSEEAVDDVLARSPEALVVGRPVGLP